MNLKCTSPPLRCGAIIVGENTVKTKYISIPNPHSFHLQQPQIFLQTVLYK